LASGAGRCAGARCRRCRLLPKGPAWRSDGSASCREPQGHQKRRIEADTIQPLAEYLTRFEGDLDGIAEAYLAHKRQGAPSDSADRIGHYKILREIGRGGQATVYLDTRLHRQVALKVLDIGPAEHQQAIDRFGTGVLLQ
jgi:hypothetical protein